MPANVITIKHSANIQAMRGVAACIVALMHCFIGEGGFLADHTSKMFLLTRIVSSFGPAGVDIFFVLSGFLIYSAATERGTDSENLLGINRVGLADSEWVSRATTEAAGIRLICIATMASIANGTNLDSRCSTN